MASKPREEPRIRWSLALAAKEFDVAKETVRRRLGESHQEPGPDQCYTTKQLTTALYGDLYGAKLRYQNEAAEKLRIENMVSRGELLSKAALSQAFAELADALSQAVRNSSLDRQAQETFLLNLSRWPVILKNVERGQSKLARRNGERHDSDDDE
jgi:hypothetical protein